MHQNGGDLPHPAPMLGPWRRHRWRVEPMRDNDLMVGCFCSILPPFPTRPRCPAGSGQQELGPAGVNWDFLQGFLTAQLYGERCAAAAGSQQGRAAPCPGTMAAPCPGRTAMGLPLRDPRLPSQGTARAGSCTQGHVGNAISLPLGKRR